MKMAMNATSMVGLSLTTKNCYLFKLLTTVVMFVRWRRLSSTTSLGYVSHILRISQDNIGYG